MREYEYASWRIFGCCVVYVGGDGSHIPSGSGADTGLPSDEISSCPSLVTDDDRVSTLDLRGQQLEFVHSSGDRSSQVYSNVERDLELEVWRTPTDPPEVTQEEFDRLTQASLADVSGDGIDYVEESFAMDELPDHVNGEHLEVRAFRILSTTEEELVFVDEYCRNECVTNELDSEFRTDELSTSSHQRFLFPPVVDETEIAPAAVYPSNWTFYLHKTFIPHAVVNDNILGVACGVFRGDNRSWSSRHTSANSRTYVSVHADWNRRAVSFAKAVGTTHRIAGFGRGPASRTASSAGIQFYGASASASSVRVRINHSVGNPLCSVAGPIQYSEVVQIFKNDAIHVQGSGVQVPSHEMYGIRASGAQKTIAWYPAKKMYCLSFNCGKYSISKSIR